MLFSSINFLIFLLIIFCLYWFVVTKNLTYQNLLLFIAGYFFYACWDWRFVFLLAFSTGLDYYTGIKISQAEDKKLRRFWLWLSVSVNLIFLGFFKYYNFFAVSFADAIRHLGFKADPWTLSIILPVGISFYTFHGLSYVFDIYNGKLQPVKNFITYAVFVCFFPLLVAGPIERAQHFLPQVQQKRVFNYRRAVEGMRLMLWGFFKKIVIADTLSGIVNKVFGNYTEYNGATLALAVIFFSIQIYCDFSGYTDIALGTSKLLGFELLSNFRFPYFSRNIAEFWRRWHISLSSWFRDYLYIPLGGSKNGKAKAVQNTFIIFIVSGFWHGANWTFIFWGLIHAVLFVPLLLFNRNRSYAGTVVADGKFLPSVKELLQMLLTFLLVTIAWIFFRSPDLATSWKYIIKMITNINSVPLYAGYLVYVVGFLFMDWTQRSDERCVLNIKAKLARRFVYFTLAVLIIFHFNFIDKTQFIYFQF